MARCKILIFAVFLFITCVGLQSNNVNYKNNRPPLKANPYIELPLGSIQPEGWMREQLNRASNGMTGHMDQLYETVMGKRNGWLGGDGDVWERGPYWIDGLLPLAYMLDDSKLKNKAQEWIEWALASQKKDGYFGPDTDRPYEFGLQRGNSRDWWPKMVMLKVLQQYYSATNDERVITLMTSYFKYQLTQLPKTPLGHWTSWAHQRGGENLLLIYWLYNITGDKFLLELGDLVYKQTFGWVNVFTTDNHLYRQYSLHCVNLAHGFKTPIVYYQKTGSQEQLQSIYKAADVIRQTIGLPTGLWAGDEMLRFGHPNAGSELCTATEMMFSLETILAITGDMKWADHLEKIAYNVLPTQISDDYGSRQYYQQLNQIAITNETRTFSTPHKGTDTLFGLLTGYPCCSSNLHQGWPKFVQHLWFATADNGLAALAFAPSKVKAKVANGVEIVVEEKTVYPFEEQLSFVFSYSNKKNNNTFFPFHIRKPNWASDVFLLINGKEINKKEMEIRDNVIVIHRNWKEKDEVSVEFKTDVNVSRWYGRSAVVERGPLLYALKLNENWIKKEFETEQDKKEFGDWYYEVTTDVPWNYSLKDSQINNSKAIKENFIVSKKKELANYPWTLNDAPISIRAKGRLLPRWKEVNGSSSDVAFYASQYDFPEEKENEIELIPYGCTTLRVAAFPVRR